MDEWNTRTLLRSMAATEPAETTVDVAAAIRGGRRRRRRRAVARVAGAALLVLGVIAAGAIPALRHGEPARITPARRPPATVPFELDQLRLHVGWVPPGTVGTFTYIYKDQQAIQFHRKEEQDGGGGGPLPSEGIGGVWLVPSDSDLTMRSTGQTVSPGPDVNGHGSSWATITNGVKPVGGSLSWTPSPGLRVMVLATTEALALQIAQSVRIDQGTPVTMPFTMPRLKGLELQYAAWARYNNGDYYGSLGFVRAGNTAPIQSVQSFWVAEDTWKLHNGKPNQTLFGRPAWLSEGPADRGVNVQLHTAGGPVVGDFDYAQGLDDLLKRAATIAVIGQIHPVKNPRDVRNWTTHYLR